MIPDWWTTALLALAAFRTWKLLGDDVILDRPRGWVIVRAFKIGGPKAKDYVETFLACPWCLGTWSAVAWWLAWYLAPHGALVVAGPFAIAAVVGLLGHLISD